MRPILHRPGIPTAELRPARRRALRGGTRLRRRDRQHAGGLRSGAPGRVRDRRFLDVFLRQAHTSLPPVVRAFAREDRYPRPGEITVLTVVMVGTADRSTPPNHSRRLAAGTPGVRLVTVPDAGHMINWEDPDALVEAIVSLHEAEGAD
ncbi:alpha/beta fold hydrolase [Streptomyces kebangsaanensis]|uniref:Alpha/beta fold hydrolase n=1 Tax=Streptomyces kebangsaanensis TaxID=864058 RepID=A0ABW6KV44_9ACTN